MALKLIDHPVSIPLYQYEALKTKITYALITTESVLSVYQMGSVKHPGISDLDIICVFKNNAKCDENLRLKLNPDEKNILTHGIFGVEEKDLVQCMSYNLISNLKFLGGEDLSLDSIKIETSDVVKKQIALEYLVKMLITIDSQTTLKIVKLRAFLLLAKAIEFDLQLLGVKNGKLYDLVQQVIAYRGRWYDNKPSVKEVGDLIRDFNTQLRSFLEEQLSKFSFHLPMETCHLPGNFIIKKANNFFINHKGVILPNQLGFLGRKYINLQYRLNSFVYNLPFKLSGNHSVLDERFQFSNRMVLTNKESYPYFIPLTTSLAIY